MKTKDLRKQGIKTLIDFMVENFHVNHIMLDLIYAVDFRDCELLSECLITLIDGNFTKEDLAKKGYFISEL